MPQDFLKLAISLGILNEADAATPINSEKDKSIDPSVVVVSPEQRAKRQELIRRIQKMLVKYRERVERYQNQQAAPSTDVAPHKANEDDGADSVAGNASDETSDGAKKMLKYSEWRKKNKLLLSPEKKLLSNY